MSSLDPCPRCTHYRGNHSAKGCRVCDCARDDTFAESSLSDPSLDQAGPRHSDAVDTEATAADLVAPRSGTLRLTALDAIATRYPGGLTDTELAERTGEYRYTMAPRRVELMKGGWVEDSGARRRTGHNRDEVVWRATARGYSEWSRR